MSNKNNNRIFYYIIEMIGGKETFWTGRIHNIIYDEMIRLYDNEDSDIEEDACYILFETAVINISYKLTEVELNRIKLTPESLTKIRGLKACQKLGIL